MDAVLAVSHRPKQFAEVVGQQHVLPVLRAVVKTSKVPPAFLFSGTRGTGKTTCARIFAAALNCENPQGGDACSACGQCKAVQKGTSNSVLEIDAASNGGVAEIRRIKDLVLYGHESQWRVVILDEAHSLSKEANNALLKLLEEPPPYTVFILVTTEPEQVLGTVRSRTMPFEFRRIRTGDLVARLQHISETENLKVSEDLLLSIADSAQGSMRDAIMILDQVTRADVSTAAEFRAFFGIQDYAVPLMWSALRGDHAEGYRLVDEHFSRTGEVSGLVADWSRLVSDLLVIQSQGRPRSLSEAAYEERVEMSKAVSAESLVRVVEVLWELRSRSRATENDQRSAMEMGFALIASAVRLPGSEPAATEREEAPRLSLEDINELIQG